MTSFFTVDASSAGPMPGLSAIVAAVRSGRTTPEEVVALAVRRITAGDAGRRIVEVVRDAASDEARALDPSWPLAGVPVLVKSENDVAGLATTFGGVANRDPADRDSQVVARLRRAGAVVVGTTRMPEFGAFPFTEGPWGHTPNPCAPHRSPGGSSGGSAAAVAAGWVPVAIGGDGGGSIRIPAACCGIVGIKPVRGRVSTAPHPDLWGDLGTIGPLARTVFDAAVVLDVIAGTVPVDSHAAPPPRESFADAARRMPGRLRIGVIGRPSCPGVAVDAVVRASLADLVGRLRGVGHDVRRLPQRWPSGETAFVPQFFAALAEETRRVSHPEHVQPLTRAAARVGHTLPVSVVQRARRHGRWTARRVERRYGAFDVLISPTLAHLPPAPGRLDGADLRAVLAAAAPMVAFTGLANVTGHAAISVPIAPAADGTPIGAQLYAPGGDETRLLPLAAQIERLYADLRHA